MPEPRDPQQEELTVVPPLRGFYRWMQSIQAIVTLAGAIALAVAGYVANVLHFFPWGGGGSSTENGDAGAVRAATMPTATAVAQSEMTGAQAVEPDRGGAAKGDDCAATKLVLLNWAPAMGCCPRFRAPDAGSTCDVSHSEELQSTPVVFNDDCHDRDTLQWLAEAIQSLVKRRVPGFADIPFDMQLKTKSTLLYVTVANDYRFSVGVGYVVNAPRDGALRLYDPYWQGRAPPDLRIGPVRYSNAGGFCWPADGKMRFASIDTPHKSTQVVFSP